MSTGAEQAIRAAAAVTAAFKAFRKFLSNEFVVLFMRVFSVKILTSLPHKDQ